MYEIGDYIIYGGEGVCRVEAVGPTPISADSDKTYYTLKPEYHGGTIYAPTDVSIRMRPIITREAALELINNIPNLQEDFERYDGAKQAAAGYKEYLQTYNCENLLHLIRMIYHKNVDAISQGKRYSQTDDRFFKKARELLYGELAIALDVRTDEVEKRIIHTVQGGGAEIG